MQIFRSYFGVLPEASGVSGRPVRIRGRRLSFRVMGKAWKNLEDKRIIDYHMIIG